MSEPLLLPDSRPRDAKGLVWSKQDGCYMQPIFCVGCHKENGLVTVGMDFVAWLCNDCSPKYGHIDGTFIVPDELHAEHVRSEQLEKHGRLLSPAELKAVVDSDSSPLATLIKQGR